MMKTLLFLFSFFTVGSIMAQAPANDLCVNAIELTIYDSEADAVPVSGTTLNTTDAANDNIPVCSANFYRDDVWYTFTTPDEVSPSGYAIRVYTDESNPDDMTSFGMALYTSCEAVATNQPFFCGSEDPVFHWDGFGYACVGANQTVYVRVWSGAGSAADWTEGQGEFRIAVYPRPYEGTDDAIVLWGEEPGQGDFNGGLNDWTLEGITCTGAPADSAKWEWVTSGFPYWIWGGEQVSRLKSKTLCNGAMRFESMFLDIGPDNVAGSGTCPQDHEGALVSPIIDISEFPVAGVSLLFNQSMQRFSQGLQFVDYSLDGGENWISIQINTEKTYLSNNPGTGRGYYNEQMRLRLPGAEGADNLRIRFRFMGSAYWWMIDDVLLIETECNNMRAQTNFFAIPPWAQVPTNQLYPFAALVDVYNAGACDQTNVEVRHTITQDGSMNVIDDQTLVYGDVPADFLDENRLFPNLISLPKTDASYSGRYEVTSDAPDDFDPSDNMIDYNFTIGGDVFALEDGETRSIAVNNTIYDDGAPLSYAYGNYFYMVNDAPVHSIVWGVSNPVDMTGYTVQIYLLQWTDTNGDQIAQASERKFVGVNSYTFTGGEGENAILETVLDNFENPGQPIVMKAGFGYIAIVEYQASVATDPQFFLLASENRNYGAQKLAMDTAFAKGLSTMRVFSSVLGFSPDGIIANIDYEVHELSGTDNRIFFGHDIVPVVRIKTGTVGVTPLPETQKFTVYPNPVSDVLRVDLDFTKTFADMQLRLIDNAGRVVYQKILNQVPMHHTESIKVADLTAGNYMLQVVTSDGVRSTPVVIVR